MCTHLGVGKKSRASAQHHQDLFRSAELRTWVHPHPAATLLSQESQGIRGKHREREAAGSTTGIPKSSQLTDTHCPGFHCNTLLLITGKTRDQDDTIRTFSLWHRARLRALAGQAHTTHLTPPTYLTGRQQKQNTAMHSQGSLVLAQVVHMSFQPKNTTAHQV